MAKLRRFDSYAAKQFLKRNLSKAESFREGELSQLTEQFRQRLANAAKKEHREIWNKFGSKYFALIRSQGITTKMLAAFFRNVQVHPESKILFLGTGPALEEAFIASRYPRAKCTFVDFSEEMHKQAKSIITSEGLKNVRLVLGDMERLPLKEKQDFVCAFGLTPSSLTKFAEAVTEARQIISNASHARFVMELHFDRAEYSIIANLIRKGGFDIEKELITDEEIDSAEHYCHSLIVAKPIQIRH